MRAKRVPKSLCVLSVVAASLTLVGLLRSVQEPAAAEPSRDGGYSIFHETMVDMAWPDIEKAAKAGAVVLMATAVIEEHGPHMSCGTDTYLGYLLCKLTRRQLESKGVKAVIAPPFFWGVNSATHVFPGTFAIQPETAKVLLWDIFASLKSMGFGAFSSSTPTGTASTSGRSSRPSWRLRSSRRWISAISFRPTTCGSSD